MESPPIEIQTVDDSPSDLRNADSAENIALQNKERLTRRLQARWRCTIPGHRFCFQDAEGNHILLTDDNLKEWVDAIHDGLETILSPPDRLLISNIHRGDSDVSSLRTTSSRDLLPYQQPFHLQRNPSLTSLRSWRMTLSSGSNSTSGLSVPESLAGNTMKWIGKKILAGATSMEIRRRLWLSQRLVNKLERKPVDDRWTWLLAHEKAFLRKIDDLLELSTGEYKFSYRENSVAYGETMRLCRHHARPGADVGDPIMELKLSVFFILSEGDNSSSSFGARLREILLQETISGDETEGMVAELAACAFNELHYGESSKSRADAYGFIRRLYRLPMGRRELERLDQLLRKLAVEIRDKPIDDHLEHGRAMLFFLLYANDHPPFRNHFLEMSGPGLVRRLKAMDLPSNEQPIQVICYTIHRASAQHWVCPVLVEHDTCNTLTQLLLSLQQRDKRFEYTEYYIISTLHNLLISGEDAKTAVYQAMKPDVPDVLQKLSKAEWHTNWMGKEVQDKVCVLVDALTNQAG